MTFKEEAKKFKRWKRRKEELKKEIIKANRKKDQFKLAELCVEYQGVLRQRRKADDELLNFLKG